MPCPLPCGHYDPDRCAPPPPRLLPPPTAQPPGPPSPATQQDSLPLPLSAAPPFHSISSSSSSSSNNATAAMAESATATAATSGGGGGGGGAAAIAIIDSLFRCHRSNADDDADDDDPEEEDGEDEAEDEERRRRGGGGCRSASDAQPRRSLQPVVARLGGHWSSSSTEFLDEASTDHRRPSRDLLEHRTSELWPQQRPRLTSSAESVTEADPREMRPKARLNQPVVGGWGDSEQPPGAAEDQEQPAMAGIPPLSSPDPSLSSIREAEWPRQPSFRFFTGKSSHRLR